MYMSSYVHTFVPICFMCRAVFISTATLMTVLGSTWVIGLFAVNEHTEAFAWIFTILNSLQVGSF